MVLTNLESSGLKAGFDFVNVNSKEKHNYKECLLIPFVIMTSNNIMRDMDQKKKKKLMNNLLVIDGRRIFKKEDLSKKGFVYMGVGCL